MTSRERIIGAIEHEQTDRLPKDLWAVPEIYEGLYTYFGTRDLREVSRLLKIDKIMPVGPVCKKEQKPGFDVYGSGFRTVRLPDGGSYEEQTYYPLASYNSIDEIRENYTFPSTDWFDYGTVAEQCKYNEGFATQGGYISLTYQYSMLRGMENMLCDFAVGPELAFYILEQINAFASGNTRKILEAGEGRVDLSEVTDDFGTQTGLLMSPEMIDEFTGEFYSRNIETVKSFGTKVFHHDDGAISGIFDWLCGKGIDVLNPLQWHLPGWDLVELKRKYGDRLCFHGGVDNQYVLPFGTAEELHKEIEDCVGALYSDRTGYIFAPCHCVQSNTSIEKVIEMFRYAEKY